MFRFGFDMPEAGAADGAEPAEPAARERSGPGSVDAGHAGARDRGVTPGWRAPEILSLDLLRARAPRISYSKDAAGMPRRDLFDVRYELMSEDSLDDEEKLLLGDEDVRKTVYEGGLKVWEGAHDLLEALRARSSRGSPAAHSVLELGCGAGLPVCYCFHSLVRAGTAGRVVLADYNAAVLTRLTMPNTVLSWLAATESPLVAEPQGELVLSADVIDAMLADLARRSVSLKFIAGAWSPRFSELAGPAFDLVLASETIYSPDSVASFADVLQRALADGVALVAAKKVYFGVGGDVVAFERLLDERKMQHEVVLEKGHVGRIVLEVKQNH